MAVLLIDGFDGHANYNHSRRWEKIGTWGPQGVDEFGRYNPDGNNPDERDIALTWMNTGFGHGGQTMGFPNVSGSLFFGIDFKNQGYQATDFTDCAIFRAGIGGAVNMAQQFVCRYDSGDGRYYYEVWSGGTISDQYGNTKTHTFSGINPASPGETDMWRSFGMHMGTGDIRFGNQSYNGIVGGTQPVIHKRQYGSVKYMIDNAYVTDGADINTGDLGECQVELLTPIADYSISSGITIEPDTSEAWEVVESYWRSGAPALPNYSDYLVSQAGEAATFRKTYPYVYDDPYAVAVTVACQAMDGPSALVYPILKINDLTYYADLVTGTFTPSTPALPWNPPGSPQDSDRTSIQYVWNRNPATGLAWTFNDLVNCQMGCYQGGGGEVRIYGIYCEVLTPVGGAPMVDGYGSRIY